MILVLVGPPASGKSHWYNQAYPPGTPHMHLEPGPRASIDEIKDAIYKHRRGLLIVELHPEKFVELEERCLGLRQRATIKYFDVQQPAVPPDNRRALL